MPAVTTGEHGNESLHNQQLSNTRCYSSVSVSFHRLSCYTRSFTEHRSVGVEKPLSSFAVHELNFLLFLQGFRVPHDDWRVEK